MPLYFRILGLKNPNISLEKDLIPCLESNDFKLHIDILEGKDTDCWSELKISDLDGITLLLLERNPVVRGELGKEELEEMKRDIQDFKPKSAVRWLNRYLEKIVVIYALELQEAIFQEKYYPILDILKNKIHELIGGIFQADDEDFIMQMEILFFGNFPLVQKENGM